MARSSLLLSAEGMLQQGRIPRCWLSASTAQGHQQVPWRQVASLQVAAVPACFQSHQHGRLCMPLQALPQHLSTASGCEAQLAAPGHAGSQGRRAFCAGAGRFHAPGCSHLHMDGRQHHMQLRQLSTTADTGRSPTTGKQDPPAAVAAGGALDMSAGMQDWQRKRPAEMNTAERLQYLHERLWEEYDCWDLEELTSVNFRGPSTTFRSTCPRCHNGSRHEDCFAVTVIVDERDAQVPARPASVVWCCHRGSCQFSGGRSLHTKLTPAVAQQYPQGPLQRIEQQQQQQLQAHLQQLQQQQQQQQVGPAQAQPQAQPWQQAQQQLLQNPWQQPQGLAASRQPQQQPSPHAPTLQQSQVLGPTAPGQLDQGFKDLTPELLQWLQDRGISKAVLDRNRVHMEQRYCGALKAFADHIAFPYFRDGVVVNVKYRALPKHFTQVKGGEQIFFGYDDAQGADEIVIVEGELDKLAIEEALFQVAASTVDGSTEPAAAADPAVFMTTPDGTKRAVVSVPAGAPSRAASTSQSQERKFKFVDDCRSLLMAAKRVVLAVDTDGPGLALAAELMRRVGPEKCLTVRWPRKDANEVLMADGPEVLKACLDAAEPVPIRGLFHFDAFRKEVWLLYTQGVKGLGMGFSTGWESVDKHYKVVPGELTVVTGLSNSGKSEWLDALTVNLAQHHDWRIAVCSLENTPVEHGRKLMEKYLEKAFFPAEYAHTVPKMSFDDVVDGIFWIDEHFHLILPPLDEMPSIDYILDKARAAVLRYGVKGLIIDPYNELDTRRRGDTFETEYVSCMLSKVKRFAQHFECHVWFVAHPRTQRAYGAGSTTLSAPSMYDISGSAHFINKADNGIVIHRPYTGTAAVHEGKDIRLTQILVRKVRNKVAGSIGDVMLSYDKATGRYVDVPS